MNFISLVGPFIKREWWEEEENVSPEVLGDDWTGSRTKQCLKCSKLAESKSTNEMIGCVHVIAVFAMAAEETCFIGLSTPPPPLPQSQFVRFFWKTGAGSDGAGRKAKILRQVPAITSRSGPQAGGMRGREH